MKSNSKILQVIRSFLGSLKSGYRWQLPILFLLLILLSVACRKNLIPTKDLTPTTPSATKDLVVSSKFNWSTTNNLNVEISPNKSGLLLIQGEKAELYCKAYVKAGNKFTTRITFPVRVDKVYLFFNGQREEVQLDGKITHVSNLK